MLEIDKNRKFFIDTSIKGILNLEPITTLHFEGRHRILFFIDPSNI